MELLNKVDFKVRSAHYPKDIASVNIMYRSNQSTRKIWIILIRFLFIFRMLSNQILRKNNYLM